MHKWRDKIWSRRFRPILVSDEPEAQIERLLYLLSHGCKEGFVLTPREWPGVHCVDALLENKPMQGTLFNRSLEYEANRTGEEFGARDFATTETVVLTPLPCWQHLTHEQIRVQLAEMIADIESASERRQAETGRPPFGADRIRRQDPHETPARSKRSPAPKVHAATKAVRRVLVERYRQFVAAYRRAAERFRAGDFAVEFPTGCFLPAPHFARARPLFAPT